MECCIKCQLLRRLMASNFLGRMRQSTMAVSYTHLAASEAPATSEAPAKQPAVTSEVALEAPATSETPATQPASTNTLPTDPNLQPQAEAFRQDVAAKFGLTNIGGYREGDPQDHGKGRAVDVMVPVGSEVCLLYTSRCV